MRYIIIPTSCHIQHHNSQPHRAMHFAFYSTSYSQKKNSYSHPVSHKLQQSCLISNPRYFFNFFTGLFQKHNTKQRFPVSILAQTSIKSEVQLAVWNNKSEYLPNYIFRIAGGPELVRGVTTYCHHIRDSVANESASC